MGKAPMNYIAEAIQTKSDQFHGTLVSQPYLAALLGGISSRIDELDKVKKALFYGKGFHAFEAGQTCENLPDLIGADGCKSVDIIHGIIGKITEAGELAEALLKCFDGQKLDIANLLEEVGDGQWYDAIICQAIGTTFDQVQRTNIDKLRARFPNKFTEYDANNRNLGIERQILEIGHKAFGDDPLVLEATADVQAKPFELKTAQGADGQLYIAGIGAGIENCIVSDDGWREIQYTDHNGRQVINRYHKSGWIQVSVDGVLRAQMGPL